MPLVLGLDAAWTTNGSSGVALVDTEYRQPRVVAVAPGYHAFLRLARGEPVDWTAAVSSGPPPLEELLGAAAGLAGKPVDVIVVDMPLSHRPITGRRPADNAVSATFGGRGCSTHTPSEVRPGPVADTLRETADRLGYPLTTSRRRTPEQPALLETYPHPALLHLTGAAYRVPYKVDKRARYWPDRAPTERRVALARELEFILGHLHRVIGAIPVDVDAAAPFRRLKAVEDAIDALICCWVGVCWLDGATDAYGDEAAAIWIPHAQAGS